ncbi:MAG: hypothetical protein KME23_16240 [Goleter apudmare HA4340-LM2]|nr:hypothetical protein [Goleter apudmare HA4340-LM2]
MTPVCLSRETLSAVPPGGNHASSYNFGNQSNELASQDRTVEAPTSLTPRNWLPNALLVILYSSFPNV